MRIVFVVLLLSAACAPRATPLAPGHPARPDAPAGRLADAPAALQPGADDAPPAPADDEPPAGHGGHGGHGSAR